MEPWFEKKFSNSYGPGRNHASNRRTVFPKSNLSYTNILVLITTLAFFGFLILLKLVGPDKAVAAVALIPSAILAGKGLWTLVTSIFMHAGFVHLFVNMVSLVFIGNFVEKLIGKKRFLGLYFAGGLFAGLFFVVIAAITGVDLNVYAVGASGAIFALGGLLAVLTPKLPVLVFFIIPMPMWAAMGVLIFGLWVLSSTMGLPIGNTAHLGGLILGLGYGFYLKRKYPRKTEMISKYFTR